MNPRLAHAVDTHAVDTHEADSDAPDTDAEVADAAETHAVDAGLAGTDLVAAGTDFFGHQPATRSDLPDPEPLLINLSRCVIEVLAGVRELDQVARWVSDDVYRHLLKRVVLSARARAVKGQRPRRPTITIGRISTSEPRDGVIEAVVMVHGKGRARAVAIRLEGLDHRWRASAVNVL